MIIKTYGIKKLQEEILSISRPFILISIRSPGLNKIDLPETPMMKSALYLSFVDDETTESNDQIFFSERDAKEIISFIDMHKNDVDLLIIQCEVGESRSTAIAMVLELYLNHDKKASNRYKRYYAPNKRVETILKKYLNTQ